MMIAYLCMRDPALKMRHNMPHVEWAEHNIAKYSFFLKQVHCPSAPEAGHIMMVQNLKNCC